MDEARRCDECGKLTKRPLVEVLVEEKMGAVATMGAESFVYRRMIYRLCCECHECINPWGEEAHVASQVEA